MFDNIYAAGRLHKHYIAGHIAHSLTHSPTYSLTHTPTHPLTHSPTLTHSHPLSPTHPLTHSPTHPLTHSPTHPLTHSPTHPLTHSRNHPLAQSPSRSLTCQSTDPPTCMLSVVLQTWQPFNIANSVVFGTGATHTAAIKSSGPLSPISVCDGIRTNRVTTSRLWYNSDAFNTEDFIEIPMNTSSGAASVASVTVWNYCVSPGAEYNNEGAAVSLLLTNGS
jgi:hypothetical protein